MGNNINPDVEQVFRVEFEINKCEECFMAQERSPRSFCKFYNRNIHFIKKKPEFCQVKTIIVEVQKE